MQDVSLRVQSSERIIIIGPTGSGKSSLLNTLNLMNQSYEGEILFEGQALQDYSPHILRTRICMVMQEPFLGEGTVQEVLDEPLSYSALKSQDHEDRAERTKSLFENFQLPIRFLDKRADQLSGGEKQRVALIRVLLLRPQILLLDEITSALDQNTSGIISRCIFDDFPGTVIAISHDPLWQKHWSRSWRLVNGKIIDNKEQL
nr:UDP-glucose/iron transport system ATP-binding protein [Candidatus Cloacimonadota bacterium]